MTSFGEIVEPGSRNAWEDWDENPESNQSELKWQIEPAVPKKINTFLLLEGRYLAECTQMQVQSKLLLVNTVSEVNLKLYQMKDSDCYVAVVKDYCLLFGSEIVELLKPFITLSDNVITIMTKPLVEYQVPELVPQEYIIRCLSTSKPVPKSLGINYPTLEQPNIISGLSAGVIFLREQMDLPGAAIVCYLEHPEEYQINELQQLLGKLNIVQIEAKQNNVLSSNLYI